MSIVIVGAGPNLGLAVGRRFGREGLAVGLVSRTQAKLDDLAAQLESEGITAAGAAADIRDSDALAAAITSLAERLGAVEVLEYSPLPAPEFMKPILETTVDDVRGPLEFSVLGAVAAARAVLGPMREAGRGTILYTTGGAAINPYPLRAGVGISFAGEVAYARMLHDELRRRGHPRRAHRDRRAHRAGRRPRAGRRRRRPVVAPRRPRDLPDADRLRRRARLGALRVRTPRRATPASARRRELQVAQRRERGGHGRIGGARQWLARHLLRRQRLAGRLRAGGLLGGLGRAGLERRCGLGGGRGREAAAWPPRARRGLRASAGDGGGDRGDGAVADRVGPVLPWAVVRKRTPGPRGRGRRRELARRRADRDAARAPARRGAADQLDRAARVSARRRRRGARCRRRDAPAPRARRAAAAGRRARSSAGQRAPSCSGAAAGAARWRRGRRAQPGVADAVGALPHLEVRLGAVPQVARPARRRRRRRRSANQSAYRP